MEKRKVYLRLKIILGILSLICAILSAVLLIHKTKEANAVEKQVNHDILDGIASETELGFDYDGMTISTK